jgi:alkanesulfonate monooxygenase SsuD/methylene tetrahydromethanopterin reductase-like flavin-dependent oxidoreductase (luciferase family)
VVVVVVNDAVQPRVYAAVKATSMLRRSGRQNDCLAIASERGYDAAWSSEAHRVPAQYGCASLWMRVFRAATV